jgi:hypothetical protein
VFWSSSGWIVNGWNTMGEWDVAYLINMALGSHGQHSVRRLYDSSLVSLMPCLSHALSLSCLVSLMPCLSHAFFRAVMIFEKSSACLSTGLVGWLVSSLVRLSTQ